MHSTRVSASAVCHHALECCADLKLELVLSLPQTQRGGTHCVTPTLTDLYDERVHLLLI
jgi:hypothetical protein